MARERLSQLDDWDLVNEDQDIRGWPVQDREGNRIGTVEELIVDTDTELVEEIVLDNGREYSNDDIEMGDQVVYLREAEDAEPRAEVVEETAVPRYEEQVVAEKTPRQGDKVVRVRRRVVEER